MPWTILRTPCNCAGCFERLERGFKAYRVHPRTYCMACGKVTQARDTERRRLLADAGRHERQTKERTE